MKRKRAKANPWWTEYLGIVIKSYVARGTLTAYTKYIVLAALGVLSSAISVGDKALPPVDFHAPKNAIVFQGLYAIESAADTTTSFRNVDGVKAPDQEITRGIRYKMDLDSSLSLEAKSAARAQSTATLS